MAFVDPVEKELTKDVYPTEWEVRDKPNLAEAKDIVRNLKKANGCVPNSDRHILGDFKPQNVCVVTSVQDVREAMFQANINKAAAAKKSKKPDKTLYFSAYNKEFKKIVFMIGTQEEYGDGDGAGMCGGVSLSGPGMGGLTRSDCHAISAVTYNQSIKANLLPKDLLESGSAKAKAANMKEALRIARILKSLTDTAVAQVKKYIDFMGADFRKNAAADPTYIKRNMKSPMTPFDVPIDDIEATIRQETVWHADGYAESGQGGVGCIVKTGVVNRFGMREPKIRYDAKIPKAAFASYQMLQDHGACPYSVLVYIHAANGGWRKIEGATFFNLACGGRWMIGVHPLLTMNSEKGSVKLGLKIVAMYLTRPPQQHVAAQDASCFESLIPAPQHSYAEVQTVEPPDASSEATGGHLLAGGVAGPAGQHTAGVPDIPQSGPPPPEYEDYSSDDG